MDRACPLVLKSSTPGPAFLEKFRQRIAQLQVTRKIEEIDFAKVRKFEGQFSADPSARPITGSFEEDLAFTNVQMRRTLGRPLGFQEILQGDDWIKKRRLFRAIDKLKLTDRVSMNKLRLVFSELSLLREGSELSVLDLARSGRTSLLERSLRTELENEIAVAGLKKTLEKFDLLRPESTRETLLRHLRHPHVQFTINLIANIYGVFPHYGIYVGKLPHIPWVKFSDSEIEDILINGLTDEKWMKFRDRHLPAYTRDRMYAAVSQIVLAVTTATMIGVYIHGKQLEERKNEVESELYVDEQLKTAEKIALEARAERASPLFDEALAKWIEDYKQAHGGLAPDVEGDEYLQARSLFEEAFNH